MSNSCPAFGLPLGSFENPNAGDVLTGMEDQTSEREAPNLSLALRTVQPSPFCTITLQKIAQTQASTGQTQ